MTFAAQGASLANGIYSMIYGADAARAIGRSEANVIGAQSEIAAQTSDFNAKVATQMATSAETDAAAKSHDFKRTMYARLAGARAVGAAQGLTLEGSPLAVDENTQAQIEYGVSRIAYGGELESSRLRNQSRLLSTQADYTRRYGRLASDVALETGDIKAGAAYLTGEGNLFRGATNLGTTLAGRQVNWSGVG